MLMTDCTTFKLFSLRCWNHILVSYIPLFIYHVCFCSVVLSARPKVKTLLLFILTRAVHEQLRKEESAWDRDEFMSRVLSDAHIQSNWRTFRESTKLYSSLIKRALQSTLTSLICTNLVYKQINRTRLTTNKEKKNGREAPDKQRKPERKNVRNRTI